MENEQEADDLALTLDGLHACLQKHSAIIVHFSGCPPMNDGASDPARLFPNDLRRVCDGETNGGVSCSTIKPSDSVCLHPDSNSTGMVGLILSPNSAASIRETFSSDAGSSRFCDGVRVGLGEAAVTLESIDRSITARRDDDHNEWVVDDFSVVGVFVGSPIMIWQARELPDSDSHGGKSIEAGAVGIYVAQVASQFPNLEIYTIKNGQFARIDVLAKSVTPVTFSDIYNLRGGGL